MANTSSFLDFILPGKGEYRDAWWEPNNNNFLALDAWAQATSLELIAARFNKASLSAFLTVGHETTGELRPTPEVLASRISPVYGFQNEDTTLYDLTRRISQVEWEMWYSREARDNLRLAQAARMQGVKNQVLSGLKDGNGYPSWLASSGADIHVDGTATPLWIALDGKLGRVRKLETVTVSGSAGTKFLHATYLDDFAGGKVVINGVPTPPANPNGTTGFDVNNLPIYFSDGTFIFSDYDVKVGDVLQLQDSSDAGNYVVKEVTAQLTIIGQFPVGGLSSINYKIYDPFKMALSVADTEDTSTSGKFCIGEVDFDGTAVTAYRARHFTDTFVGEWKEIDVSSTPTFEEIYSHNLGSDVLDFSVQVSATNDGLSPIEELSLTTITRNLGISVNSSGLTLAKTDTTSFNQGTLPTFVQGSDTPPSPSNGFVQGVDTFNGGSLPALSGTINYALTGAVTSTITGDVYPDSSVRVKWSRTKIWIKNAESGKFYKGYNGVATQTGYLRVIVRKRG